MLPAAGNGVKEAPAPPPLPKAQTITLPTSYAMPGRPSPETIGQRVLRMRAEGNSDFPDPAQSSGYAAVYILDAPSASGRTVQ